MVTRKNTMFSDLTTLVGLEACKTNYDLAFNRDSDRRDWVKFYDRNGLPKQVVGQIPTEMPNVEQNLRTINGKTVFVME